jgi:magnesium-transporting ATPase (P-type)
MNAKKKVKRSSPKEFKAAKPAPAKVETVLLQEFERETESLFPKGDGLRFWFKRYSPVIITQGIALLTYFYLVFYMFYPEAIMQGNYMRLLIMLVFVFLLAGLFIYMALRSDMIFIRIISFIFVFIIFTFLLLFILLAYALKANAFM